MPMDFYDREGKPISLEEWSKRLSDFQYKIVARSVLGAEKEIAVSTVWLGMDHGFGWITHPELEHAPIIFETMIFGGEMNENMWRYATEEQALEGHRQAVALVKTMLDLKGESTVEDVIVPIPVEQENS